RTNDAGGGGDPDGGAGSADCVRADANRTGPAVQQGNGVDAAMVRSRRLQRRHRRPGTRVRPRAHEARRLGTPPRGARSTDSRRARMKAVRLLEYGGQLVFNDVPTPTIARDEILVKIKSTAVNHLDLVEASGTARQILPIDLPWIPGHEFSGVVEQIGRDVAAYAP